MRLVLLLLALALCLALAGPAEAAPLMQLWPPALEQGQPVLVSVRVGRPLAQPSLSLLGRSFPLFPAPDGSLLALAGVDLEDPVGPCQAQVLERGQVVASQALSVRARDYGTRKITVDAKFMELDAQTLARNQDETARQKAVYAQVTPARLWQGPWRMPLDSTVVGVFGRRSLVNGQPRSPHGGLDLRGALGTPILAPAAGRVALVLDTYFSGLVVLVDHGLGVVSAYRHLSQALVQAGQSVRPGQTIGLVGASGRVTGPHLHYDVHLDGARVDPTAWTELSRHLAQRLGQAPKQPTR